MQYASKKFTWHKKIDKDAQLPPHEHEARAKLRRELAQRELASFAAARERAHAPLDAIQAQQDQSQRSSPKQGPPTDLAWTEQESSFAVLQDHRRAGIRLLDGRSEPVDSILLNHLYLSSPTSHEASEFRDAFLEDLSLITQRLLPADIGKLLHLVDFYHSHETNDALHPFWDALGTLLREDTSVQETSADSVGISLQEKFSEKPDSDLHELYAQITTKPSTDFWLGLKMQVELELARRCLSSFHDSARAAQASAPPLSPQSTLPRSIPQASSAPHPTSGPPEVPLSRSYPYAARKPRYFNSVRLGHDWNTYNRAHYSRDNPPPKGIQGYRFNIMYPDLANPHETPSYRVLKSRDMYTTLIFRAGPPYEDIAFRILNRDWEFSERRGFRNIFSKGTLQLHFAFKKIAYKS